MSGGRGSGSRKGIPNKLSMNAILDMDRLGINPIEALWECYQEAMKSYKSGRGMSEKGDAGSAYLAVATKAATELANYKHPKLSAIAVKDMSESDQKKALTTEQAIAIIKSDPFATKEVQQIETRTIVEAMDSTLKNQKLPFGDANN